MSDEKLQYAVLLDKKQGEEKRGLVLLGGGELRGAYFYREGKTGVADSIQAVQDAGLLQVPTYAFVNGRSFAGLKDPVWANFQDSLGERLTLNIDKDYKGVSKGEMAADVQGGGLFMPRHELIRDIVNGNKLVNRAMPISSEDKDLLLGERCVYRWNGKELETVPVNYFFTSFEQFQDVSGTSEFQRALRDLSAVYVVLRSASEARKNPSSYRPINVQLENPDLIISAGGMENLNRMLMERPDEKTGEQVPRFNWTQFGSGNDGYKNLDTGRVGVLGINSCNGVSFSSNLFSGSGGSCGVAPEALEAWRGAPRTQKGLESKVSK